MRSRCRERSRNRLLAIGCADGASGSSGGLSKRRPPHSGHRCVDFSCFTIVTEEACVRTSDLHRYPPRLRP